MSKHGKELSSETKSVIIKLIERGLLASEISKRLNINESTISQFLKRWRERNDVENKPQVGRPKVMSKRGEQVLSRIVKCNRSSCLKDLLEESNQLTPCKVSTRKVQRKLHFYTPIEDWTYYGITQGNRTGGRAASLFFVRSISPRLC